MWMWVLTYFHCAVMSQALSEQPPMYPHQFFRKVLDLGSERFLWNWYFMVESNINGWCIAFKEGSKEIYKKHSVNSNTNRPPIVPSANVISIVLVKLKSTFSAVELRAAFGQSLINSLFFFFYLSSLYMFNYLRVLDMWHSRV